MVCLSFDERFAAFRACLASPRPRVNLRASCRSPGKRIHRKRKTASVHKECARNESYHRIRSMSTGEFYRLPTAACQVPGLSDFRNDHQTGANEWRYRMESTANSRRLKTRPCPPSRQFRTSETRQCAGGIIPDARSAFQHIACSKRLNFLFFLSTPTTPNDKSIFIFHVGETLKNNGIRMTILSIKKEGTRSKSGVLPENPGKMPLISNWLDVRSQVGVLSN